VSKQSRHGFVDALRGFSLLGILVVNVEYIFQHPDLGFGEFSSGIDQTVRWMLAALGQLKIYPIFALLFGYGLSIQRERARSADLDLGPRYRRRMFGLVLLGVVHGVLFFPGDILVIYAVVGSLASRLAARGTASLLRIAGWVYGVASMIWLGLGILDAGSYTPSTAMPSANEMAALAHGSFPAVVAVLAQQWVIVLLFLSLVQGPAVFAAFLVGIALGRTRILAEPASHRALANRVLRWAPAGVALSAVGATLTVVGGRWETLGFAIGFASSPLMAAAYIAILARTIGRRSSRVSQVLEASGRMSLSVYLLESFVAATLAYGYGFSLIGDVGPLAAMGWALGIWLGLSAFAVVWLGLFRIGPLEWVLRSFTYGSRQPLRR